MNRPNNISTFVQLMNEISKKYPWVYKHTHVLIGFPKETEKDFNLTLDVIKRVKFEYVDILLYSKRPNTKAINMGNHVSKSVINSRYKKQLN